jgi:hypothetical protein
VRLDLLDDETLGLAGRIESFARALEDLGHGVSGGVQERRQQEQLPVSSRRDDPGAWPQHSSRAAREEAFERATAAWHARYLSTFREASPQVGAEQAHAEAVGDALEEFLGVYERERTR